MKQLTIKLTDLLKGSSKHEQMQLKALKINDILGNDLDLEIQQKLHKHNNKLKRFVRSVGLLRNQIALTYDDSEYTELLYDAFLKRSSIILEEESQDIINITIPNGYKQENLKTGELIFDGDVLLNLFKDYINKNIPNVMAHIDEIEEGSIVFEQPTLNKLDIERQIVFGLTDCIYEQDSIVSIPYMVGLNKDQVDETLMFARETYIKLFDELHSDVELIRLIQKPDDLSEYKPLIEGYVDEDNENFNVEYNSGIEIHFDDITVDILKPFYRKEIINKIFYIDDIYNDDVSVNVL